MFLNISSVYSNFKDGLQELVQSIIISKTKDEEIAYIEEEKIQENRYLYLLFGDDGYLKYFKFFLKSIFKLAFVIVYSINSSIQKVFTRLDEAAYYYFNIMPISIKTNYNKNIYENNLNFTIAEGNIKYGFNDEMEQLSWGNIQNIVISSGLFKYKNYDKILTSKFYLGKGMLSKNEIDSICRLSKNTDKYNKSSESNEVNPKNWFTKIQNENTEFSSVILYKHKKYNYLINSLKNNDHEKAFYMYYALYLINRQSENQNILQIAKKHLKKMIQYCLFPLFSIIKYNSILFHNLDLNFNSNTKFLKTRPTRYINKNSGKIEEYNLIKSIALKNMNSSDSSPQNMITKNEVINCSSSIKPFTSIFSTGANDENSSFSFLKNTNFKSAKEYLLDFINCNIYEDIETYYEMKETNELVIITKYRLIYFPKVILNDNKMKKQTNFENNASSNLQSLINNIFNKKDYIEFKSILLENIIFYSLVSINGKTSLLISYYDSLDSTSLDNYSNNQKIFSEENSNYKNINELGQRQRNITVLNKDDFSEEDKSNDIIKNNLIISGKSKLLKYDYSVFNYLAMKNKRNMRFKFFKLESTQYNSIKVINSIYKILKLEIPSKKKEMYIKN